MTNRAIIQAFVGSTGKRRKRIDSIYVAFKTGEWTSCKKQSVVDWLNKVYMVIFPSKQLLFVLRTLKKTRMGTRSRTNDGIRLGKCVIVR